jgi:hypothetical protein
MKTRKLTLRSEAGLFILHPCHVVIKGLRCGKLGFKALT